MSRAFVSESDMDFEGEIPEFKSPLPKGTRNYTTPEGAKKLQDEMRSLTEEQRPKLSRIISKFMYEGDSADKNALEIAKYELSVLDREIEYLSQLIRSAEVIHPDVYESKPDSGLISWISPVAKALKGRQVGDIVTVNLPENELQLKVISIK